MTTQEIQQYIDAAIRSNFDGYTSQSGEMMTDEGGDGRFFGKVIATMYSGLPEGQVIYLAIGQTDKQTQIVKFGDSTPISPPSGPAPRLLQGPPSKSKFLAAAPHHQRSLCLGRDRWRRHFR